MTIQSVTPILLSVFLIINPGDEDILNVFGNALTVKVRKTSFSSIIHSFVGSQSQHHKHFKPGGWE
uniref:Secreted protein n=1 Tax=Heterorhabditis bacteriophora TaxID=37862 RepID=A0A1I7X1T7_HETBA